MVTAAGMNATALDAAWIAWLADNPGHEARGPEERGDHGSRFLPVEFVHLGWRGLLMRLPTGQVVAYWEG